MIKYMSRWDFISRNSNGGVISTFVRVNCVKIDDLRYLPLELDDKNESIEI